MLNLTRLHLGIAHESQFQGLGIRRESGHQNGKSDEIRIVCSGNDHWDRPNFDQRPTGDASTNLPASVPQSDLPEPSARPRTNPQGRIIQLQLDVLRGCDAMGRSVDKGDATETRTPDPRRAVRLS